MPEKQPIHLSTLPEYDAVVVLGKNLGFRWNKDKIRKQREHLAIFGRANTDAGVILHDLGKAKKLLFSTGVTVSDLDSEAQLMKNHALRIRPSIPDEDFILEEVSKQTRGNAVEVKKVLEQEGLLNARVGLVTMGFHMRRAQARFHEVGLNLDPLPSEEIVGEKYPSILPAQDFQQKMLYLGEKALESVFRIVQRIPFVNKLAEGHVESARS